jgi:hypothetical protein
MHGLGLRTKVDGRILDILEELEMESRTSTEIYSPDNICPS